jgi:transposase-like protein
MAKRKKAGGGKHVVHPAEFKLRAVQRMEAGECVSALSRELGVRWKLLYFWREGYRKRGLAALERRPGRECLTAEQRRDQMREDAERQIAELERKVGRQTLLIDFFQRAFKRVGDLRRGNNKLGAKASTGRSDV